MCTLKDKFLHINTINCQMELLNKIMHFITLKLNANLLAPYYYRLCFFITEQIQYIIYLNSFGNDILDENTKIIVRSDGTLENVSTQALNYLHKIKKTDIIRTLPSL